MENWLESLNCPGYLITLFNLKGFIGTKGFHKFKRTSSGELIDIISNYTKPDDESIKWLIIRLHRILHKDIMKEGMNQTRMMSEQNGRIISKK